MRKRWYDYLTLTLIAGIIALPLCSFSDISPVSASQRTLSWSIVDTPNNGTGGIIVSPSEINALALGPDSKTFYLANSANITASLYKSTDAGVTWNRLTATGVAMPVWDLAISPDDPNFVIAVTGSTGPTQVFLTSDGGNTWQNTSLTGLTPGEYISCVNISGLYAATGQARDIAVGTRSAAGTGSIYNVQFNSTLQGTWSKQTPLNNNIYSLKFSPNYNTDFTIVVIYYDTATSALKLTFGLHSPTPNTTLWNDQVNLNFAGLTLASLIGTDLALPSDFSADVLVQQAGCFASVQTDNLSGPTRVYYVNTSLSPSVLNITPSMTTAPTGRICSLAYMGSESSGILLAGEVFANPVKGLVNIWQSSNAQSSTIGGATWIKSDDLKSPTGGGNSGLANAILNWSADGSAVYCGTSSENATAGGTGLPANTNKWPFSKTIGRQFDESAFSRSPDSGITWNQIGLIDTIIDHLTDVAALEVGENTYIADLSSVLYLATAENITDNFTSIWRSTSDPLGNSWERILLRPKLTNNGSILRINPRKEQASKAVVFAELQTDNILYSSDQGQTWQIIQAGAQLNDITLQSDSRMYILDDNTVRQVNRSDSGWLLGTRLNTNMDSPGHTVCTPLKNRGGTEIVLVGSDFGASAVAWADFAQIIAKFTVLKALPEKNSWVHVVADSQYDENQLIYAGLNLNTLSPSTSSEGSIYRWKIGKSTSWDELDPPNRAFFGIEMLNNVLYGAWNYCATDLAYGGGGVDRTLYPTVKVPPAPEWDDLTTGLPTAPPVQFTKEPTSLKVSSSLHNTLWAIDNPLPLPGIAPYDFPNNKGCLWSYVDSVALLGPWPTSPPTGGLVGADPVTGRSQQIDLKWRPLEDIYGYDILLAKDVNFTLLLSREALNQAFFLTPTDIDNKTGAWVMTPADQTQPSTWISPGVLEAGRTYYWRVRGSRGIPVGDKETIIHSPWSPVMLFSVKPGFAVRADYNGPTLLTPVDGPCQSCKPPVRFSWTPIKNATKYEFVLSSDPELKEIITKTITNSTAFEYTASLELSKPYYWQVKAVSPVISDASPVGTFSIISTTAAPQTQKEAPKKQQPAATQTPSDFWIWIIIVIAMVLLLLINLYAFISRQRD